MRGLETVDYVDRIRARWADYCGVAGDSRGFSGGSIGGGFHGAPVKAKRKYSNKHQL